MKNVLAPLARALAPGGRMITIQSTGRDPGMEIIRAVWPDEDPFLTPRDVLIDVLRGHLEADMPDLAYDGMSEAEFPLPPPARARRGGQQHRHLDAARRLERGRLT